MKNLFRLRRPRFSYWVLVFILGGAATYWIIDTRLPERPPNILLIMADDIGIDTLGSYGGRSYHTPHIDSLSAEGMRFTHCYSMPVCYTSRLTLMSGQYPVKLGYPKWGSYPKEIEAESIGNIMKNGGYATAVAGKWQMTRLDRDVKHPKRLGFDEWCLFGWKEGYRYYNPLVYVNGDIMPNTKGKYGPEIYTDFLTNFMTKNKDRPFFAYYPMALAHDVSDDIEPCPPFRPGTDRYDTFEEMVNEMDVQVGRLLKTLEQLGIEENTIVIFTSDNGTNKNYIHTFEKGRYIRRPVKSILNGKEVLGGKGNLTNDGTNVPLLIRWPRKFSGGTSKNDLVDFSDFYPTLRELAGQSIEDNPTDGFSFLQRLTRNKPGFREVAYSDHLDRRWVRTQRWKLYGQGSFYDMENDPLEKQNMTSIDQPAIRKVKAKLHDYLNGISNE